MTEPTIDERTPSPASEHPPFRMRERRRRVLPDLMLPTLDELRWAARQRRLQREVAIPQPRTPSHVAPSVGPDGRAAPLYWRLLRLRHTRPNGWLRALFFEGAVATAVVLVLAEAASVWTIVVLPFVVAVVVKANDVLAGSLQRSYRAPRQR